MTTANDLVDVADRAGGLLHEMREAERVRELGALKKACEELNAAWSGSNIGYHASVYTASLRPAAGVNFSPEWGLMSMWPTHEPHPIWQIFDSIAIEEEILNRAGHVDLVQFKEQITTFRKRLDALREDAISILSASGFTADSFIDRKLHQIEKLQGRDVVTVVRSLYRIASFTRDSQAATQGEQPAPHQAILAIPVASRLIEEALETLEQACRDCARHLGRSKVNSSKRASNNEIVFIGHGHSLQWRELKDFLKDRLHLKPIEFNHVSAAGIGTVERLSEMLDSAMFAFVVMTAEDELKDGEMIARQNVIHEAGLFQGRLGFRRAIVLVEDGCAEFSNISGLGQIRYPKGKISAAFEEVRAVLEREAIIEAAKA